MCSYSIYQYYTWKAGVLFFPRKPPNSLIYIPCPHSNRHTQIGGWIDNLCLEAKCLRMTIVMRGAKKKTFYLTEFLNGFLIMNTYKKYCPFQYGIVQKKLTKPFTKLTTVPKRQGRKERETFLSVSKKVPPLGNIKIRLVFGLCCILLILISMQPPLISNSKKGGLEFQ